MFKVSMCETCLYVFGLVTGVHLLYVFLLLGNWWQSTGTDDFNDYVVSTFVDTGQASDSKRTLSTNDAVEYVTAPLRKIEQDSRSEVVFCIDEWSIDFGLTGSSWTNLCC